MSGYHINEATCHACPCKVNFDAFKTRADKAEAEVARLRAEHSAQREVDLAVLREWKRRAETAEAALAKPEQEEKP